MISVCMQMIAVAMLSGFAFLPANVLSTAHTLTVPGILLPAHTLSKSVAIVPSGTKTIAATNATGTLTLYNGLSLSQSLPATFTLTTPQGIEIALNHSVIIPPGNAPSYGVATVSAYAVVAGRQGNISAYALNTIYASSLYIKNLTAFTGGKDASTMIYATAQDKANAREAARMQVEEEQAHEEEPGLLQHPCTEVDKLSTTDIVITLSCQYMTYQVPRNARVLSASVDGTNVILQVETVVQAA